MPPLAIIGAGLAIGGIGAVASANSNKKSATIAANTAQNTTNQNNALASNIYDRNSQTLAPYVQAGLPANALLGGAAGYGDQAGYQNAFGNFIKNSDYGFQFGEGANRVNSGYAGNGTVRSGAAMQGIERLRQNLQSGYRGEFNALLGNQQALGMNAASAQAGVATNYSNNVQANNTSAGTAAANAALLRGQNNPFAAMAGLVGGGLTSYGMGL